MYKSERDLPWDRRIMKPSRPMLIRKVGPSVRRISIPRAQDGVHHSEAQFDLQIKCFMKISNFSFCHIA